MWGESRRRTTTVYTARVDVVDPGQYEAVYLVGGHGTMWDFPDSEGLQNLVASVYNAGGWLGGFANGTYEASDSGHV